jgi:uncharacterized protein (TIGR02145 family)
MKTNFKFLVVLGFIFIFPGLSTLSQVSINANGDPPDNSAILDVKSTSKGLLIPRMTQSELTAINSPANGLQVFCTTDNKLYIFLSSINRWKEVEFGSGELLPPAIFSIGTGSACANTVVNGTYYPAVSLTTSSFVTIQVNVSTIGTYFITTNTVNGYSFSTSGEFSTTGSQTINLMGNGTPVTAQTDQFTATASNSGGTCTFSVLVWTPCPGIPTISYGGQIYNTVQIGTQCWLKENLNIGTRIDGSIAQTDNSTIEKWCYNNLESNCDVYGGMYQWAEMVQYLNGATNYVSWNPVPTGNVIGICPNGWHIPSDAEWTTLFNSLGGIEVAGGKMKETGTEHWLSPNTGATNSSGFTGLPSGRKDANFVKLGEFAPYYSSTQTTANNMWTFYLYSDDVKITYVWHLKTNGIPARCVKD